MPSERRYYVRHDVGMARGNGPYPALPAISYIRDRWYCCRDVARLVRRPNRTHRGEESVAKLRRRAEALCAEWNAENDAWLARNVHRWGQSCG